ncbi:hypothetical protein GUITHDRAFT_107222 [Guillardia theta CCMP2712]|uniref:Uncharacterized protein n=1 Tax=Guillardia theta (strain CCMP2712) TaxID=905079 RepID=L1JEF9_GUITC|nr:hypothetical protein GUITHDRAFT_107222 [Guillardia theta CCMP2712]EKX46866.1 hypothetical protein GUITHDRAFT_107222 [Guillardia theta CCMP2712]|eukprot:XP_005833846.1 hypothetical protein GUITHDRAFT_107222 [Guillardia theta CCMP2712]
MAPKSFQIIRDLRMYAASATEPRKSFRLNEAQKACMDDMVARAKSKATEELDAPTAKNFVFNNILVARVKLNSASKANGSVEDPESTRKRSVPESEESALCRKLTCTRHDIHVF